MDRDTQQRKGWEVLRDHHSGLVLITGIMGIS